MEGSESGQGAVSGETVAQIGQIQCDPKRFQVLGVPYTNELDALGGRGAAVQCTKGMLKDGVQAADLNDEQATRAVNQQPCTSLEDRLSFSPRGIEGHQLGSAEEPLEQSITGMLTALSLELRAGFETSNANQKEIRGMCETLGRKIDELAGRTAALEEEVGDLRSALGKNKEELQSLRAGEEKVLLKLESVENNQRRNNLRILKVPEGMEGGT
ncbi:hypothetical protein NDU88_003606 [Pleurodeles waltl]|uniref:Uncharacterized protein n=1 Tax=Pleurodeles waltl TaxID=8319 RepID=A0AAV7UYY2_PLEWA|nr:hypothetical protein NDU88_003606 [Pleurodeles waltl]